MTTDILYCNECINSINSPPMKPKLLRQNALLNIHFNNSYKCSKCKNNVTICDIKTNTNNNKIDSIQLQHQASIYDVKF